MATKKAPAPWKAGHAQNWPVIVDAQGKYVMSLLGIAAGDPIIHVVEKAPQMLAALRSLLARYDARADTFGGEQDADMESIRLMLKSITWGESTDTAEA